MDYYYLILVIPALIISLIAQFSVKSTYKKMSGIYNDRGITGANAALNVLRYYGITDVSIEQTSGKLTDHYSPKEKVIRLSPEVFSGRSIAAVGIACHEAGHAAQHAESYLPIRIRNTILPIANFGSSAGVLIAFLGLFLGLEPVINIGIILFAAVVLFQFLTLPVEFNASHRAVKVIGETNLLQDDEMPKAKKVLRAAAMTYVASLLVSVMSLVRLILRTRRR